MNNPLRPDQSVGSVACSRSTFTPRAVSPNPMDLGVRRRSMKSRSRTCCGGIGASRAMPSYCRSQARSSALSSILMRDINGRWGLGLNRSAWKTAQSRPNGASDHLAAHQMRSGPLLNDGPFVRRQRLHSLESYRDAAARGAPIPLVLAPGNMDRLLRKTQVQVRIGVRRRPVEISTRLAGHFFLFILFNPLVFYRNTTPLARTAR